MSLYITYRTENGKAMTISDALLTTIKSIDNDENNEITDSGSFLPYNLGIALYQRYI